MGDTPGIEDRPMPKRGRSSKSRIESMKKFERLERERRKASKKAEKEAKKAEKKLENDEDAPESD
jgi:hypothetical protein